MIGRTASELNIIYDPDDLFALRQMYEKEGRLRDFEIRYFIGGSNMRVALLSSEEIYLDKMSYTLTSGLDITDRKVADAEREHLIANLQSKNDELERFAYTVSHDLKSPLVTINGFLGYLELDAESGNVERLKSDTFRIKEAVRKMQKLLNELLDLSRIGRLINKPETLSPADLAHDALEIVQGRINQRGVIVRVHPDLPSVHGDKARLVEVFQNLLDNAAKYMGEQSFPRIEIGQNGEENGKPIFFVTDNGMGIEPQYHDRVFGLFNKLDAKSEGTGVGLALVKRIIEISRRQDLGSE